MRRNLICAGSLVDLISRLDIFSFANKVSLSVALHSTVLLLLMPASPAQSLYPVNQVKQLLVQPNKIGI
jgi:hypothetical protein